MSYAIQLRENLARNATAMRALLDAAKKENRGLNTEERTRWDNMVNEHETIKTSIEAAEKLDGIENELSSVPGDKVVPFPANRDLRTGGSNNQRDDSPHAKAFSNFLRNGIEGISSDEQRLMRSRMVAPTPGIQNAQTITTTGGGYLIPQGFSGELEEALKWYGGIVGNVGEFTTETGNPLPWPTVNDTTSVGGILGINTQQTEADFTFGQITFNAYIFQSYSVLVPLALIQDSFFDLDQFVARNLGIRLGRAINKYGTTGTGTNQPNGIVTATVAAGDVVTGQTGESTSITYIDLVNTLHAVDPAYRLLPTAKWMFADSTLKTLRKMVDASNRPLWQPGLTAGFGQPFPETILDRPYVINQDMASMAANAYSLLYGDLSKYKLRRVAGGTTIMRLVERYADYLQVGFQGFLRADGQLLDAGTHPIAAFQNSAS